MNKDNIPFQKQQQVNPTENQEKGPWKLGRYVKPHHEELLDKLVKDYKQYMLMRLSQMIKKK